MPCGFFHAPYKHTFSLLFFVLVCTFLLHEFDLMPRKIHAATTTSLYFQQTSTYITPIELISNETQTLDVIIDPGSNKISFLKVEIQYDPAVVSINSGGFIPNTEAFPLFLEGPIYANGKVSFAMSIGGDPANSITSGTKIGSLTVHARETTATSVISFGSGSAAYSLHPDDLANENVLGSKLPTFISVTAQQLSPTPQQKTQIMLAVTLHGIGSGGDNVNSTSNSLSNKTPQTSQRELTLALQNNTGYYRLLRAASIFNPASGAYEASIPVDISVPDGAYSLSVKSGQHLARTIPGIFTIQNGKSLTLPSVTLTAGDTNNDNYLDILDYNMLRNCYTDFTQPLGCSTELEKNADITDDGSVNQSDYNLFIRELSTRRGE
jgi:hypothetical protein